MFWEAYMKRLIPALVGAGGTFLIASPAMAGTLPTPLPAAGAGLLALAGLGVGYRLVKRRFDR
jgi:drug/metabolite transporter (DMT)-like permease